MGLRMPFHVKSQWQLATEQLSEYLSKVDGKYALSEFADTDSFRIVVPFTSSKSRIRGALRKPDFWEATDIQDAVNDAVQYIHSAGLTAAAPTKIVVVSDGIETRGPLFSLPAVSSSDAPPISLELLPVALPFNPAAEKRLSGIHGSGSEPIEYHASSSLLYLEDTGRGWYRMLFILLGIVTLGPLLVCSIWWLLNRRAGSERKTARKSKPANGPAQPEQYYEIHFIEYNRRAENREHRMEFPASGDGIPLEIGEQGFVQSNRRKCNVLISFEEDGCFLNCDTPLLINGVSVRRRKLKPGIIIHFARVRLKLVSIERKIFAPDSATAKPRSSAVDREQSCFKPLLPLWAAGVLIIAVIYAVLSLTGMRTEEGTAVRREVRAYLKFWPYDWEREFLFPVEDYDNSAARPSEKLNEKISAESGADGPLEMVQGRWNGQRWDFAGLENEQHVDYLCFHAHPDDEALDFGGLLAKLEQSNQRVAVVLFTDGESGLSRGPEQVFETNARVLKSVRINEAANSLKILGADFYVRLGFRNHPYSSQLQVLPIEQVYTAWGGRRQVEAAVEQLIERLRPRVIVSPDGPSDAREHFEHEAVGEAVRQVVEKMQRTQSAALPQRHMRLIDPMQQHVYRNLTEVNVLRPVWPYSESPRSLQNRALKAHRSQIDARIVGLEYTPLFDSEYYQVRELHE